MKILSWNCQGLGNPCTVNALRDWCGREKPNIVFLMETMIEASKLERIRNICGFVQGVCLSSNGRAGGIGFWWRDINVVPSSFSNHHFVGDVYNNQDELCWRAVGIYGWPERENKHRTWAMMSRIKSMSSAPCVMFGYFNEILCMEEKEGGADRSEREMDAFRDALDDCGLCDLGYKGCKFTWKKGNNPLTVVRERLDRFVADVNWCGLFPNYMVKPFAQYRSDHAPILLTTWNAHDRGRQHNSFRFEALWLSKPECGEVVAESWEASRGENVEVRIESCANKLKQWAANSFGNIKKQIKKTEEKLKVAQCRDPDATMLQLCNDLSNELDALHKQEESYWFARARANELRNGDKNTAYFHRRASQRKHYNTISGLFDDNNVWKDSP